MAGSTAGAGGAGNTAGTSGGGAAGGAGIGGATNDAGVAPDAIESNRQRLLETYVEFLTTTAAPPQTNGLSGSNVSNACDLWQKLDPSSQATFLTLTARMQGSVLASDGRPILSHVVKLYRISGGKGASGASPGSCGGGEYNRLMLSMDADLHAAQLAASQHQGALQPNGKYDIADVQADTSWRDSHDLGGAHAPFDLTNETNQGAPRGQTQYFADPTSLLAASPLGRTDLESLVDPYALEIDHDYDCFHNSNPTCSYVAYGPACLPQPSALGADLYAMNYGAYGAGWSPTCD